MTQRLKRWESPRKPGRNSKGRGGSARRRQQKKQMQMLRQRLKQQNIGESPNKPTPKGGANNAPPFLVLISNE